MSETKWTTSRLTEIRHLVDETYSSMDTLRLDDEAVRLRLEPDDLPARIDFNEDDQCWVVTIGEDQNYLSHERGPSLIAAYILAAEAASEAMRYTSDALADRAKDLERKYAARDDSFVQHIRNWQPTATLKPVKNAEGGIQNVEVEVDGEDLLVIYNSNNQTWALVAHVHALIDRQRICTSYYPTLQEAAKQLYAMVWNKHINFASQLDDLENKSRATVHNLKDILDPA